MLRRSFSPARLSTNRIGRLSLTRRSVRIRLQTFGPIGFLVMVAALFLRSPAACAQGLVEQWNVHGPQQYSEGSSGTWLDRLRSNSQSNATLNDFDRSRTEKTDAEFDLQDFLEEPGSDSENIDAITPLVSSAQEVESLFGEPVNPAPTSYSIPDFDEPSLLSDDLQSRQMSPEVLFSDGPPPNCRGYIYQILPKGLMYRSYLAADREPRMQFLHLYDTRSKQIVWDAVLGGRVGLLRYGTVGPARTEVFQLDLEGAVFARVLPSEPSSMLTGSDYRVGMFGTWKFDRTAWKAGFYHLSSHVGDEYQLAHPLFQRINYVRDSLLTGISYDLSDISRIYGEIGYAIGVQDGAKPLELQAGFEYTPIARSSLRGAPFCAINGHFREEFDLGCGVNLASGWGWHGRETGHRLRIGLNYYNGPSLQYEFFDQWENLVGGGIWFDY